MNLTYTHIYTDLKQAQNYIFYMNVNISDFIKKKDIQIQGTVDKCKKSTLKCRLFKKYSC